MYTKKNVSYDKAFEKINPKSTIFYNPNGNYIFIFISDLKHNT